MAHRMKENWCRVFEKDDYEVLAYHNDLKSYWLKGYGHADINSLVALILFKDLFANIESFIKNSTTQLEYFQIRYKETFYKLFYLLEKKGTLKYCLDSVTPKT